MLVAVELCVLIFAGFLWWGIKAIENAEEEYDRDPDAYKKKHPEHREFF